MAVAWVMIMKIPWMMVTLGFKSLNGIVRTATAVSHLPVFTSSSVLNPSYAWSRPRLLQAQLWSSQSGQNIADKEPDNDNELKQPEQTRQISEADSP